VNGERKRWKPFLNVFAFEYCAGFPRPRFFVVRMQGGSLNFFSRFSKTCQRDRRFVGPYSLRIVHRVELYDVFKIALSTRVVSDRYDWRTNPAGRTHSFGETTCARRHLLTCTTLCGILIWSFIRSNNYRRSLLNFVSSTRLSYVYRCTHFAT